ncbi:uncharacterized protein LOC144152408 isoform X2 [Haemaphysalis longicornis]
MVWCFEFQHTADATARSKKASQCGPGPAALPPSRLSTPPPWPATCGTVSSKASTGAFAVITLQLPPIWFRQGDQRQRTHQQPYSQRLSVGSSHSLGRPPYSQPRWPSGPGTELLGGLAEAISVVQHEPQVAHPGLPPELLAVGLQACDPAAGLGVPVNKHCLHLGARQLQADIGELGPHCIRGCLQLQNDASAARHGA